MIDSATQKSRRPSRKRHRRAALAAAPPAVVRGVLPSAPGRLCRLLAAVLVAAATIPWTPLPAQEIPAAVPEDVGMSSEGLRAIDAAVQKHIDAGTIQGAVTAVARRGRVVHFEAYGLADVEAGRTMEKDSIFRMASSSKPILGVAAMIAVEDGLFDPADEVAKYLPDFETMQVAVQASPADEDVSPEFVAEGSEPEHRLVPARRPLTIHDLLTHTAGLGSYGLGSAVGRLPARGAEDTLATLVPLYATMPLDFQPGARWSYSPGIGLDVVARIIEVVSGKPYDEFVHERIFAPLGMADTHFHLPPAKEPRRVVIHGLDPKIKGWNKPSRYVSASGGLSSTAEDFLRFEQMLASGGTLFGNRVLAPESVAAMSSDQVDGLYGAGGKQAGSAFGYTVSIVVDPAAAGSARGRGAFGWGGAFGTVSWTDPDLELVGVFLVQQATKGVIGDVEKAIRAAIVD